MKLCAQQQTNTSILRMLDSVIVAKSSNSEKKNFEKKNICDSRYYWLSCFVFSLDNNNKHLQNDIRVVQASATFIQ